MDVVISFFLGSMVLFQIFMGFIVIGIIFAAISPNMRAHISHFLGYEEKTDTISSTPASSPINVTPPPNPELKSPPQLEKTTSPAINVNFTTKINEEPIKQTQREHIIPTRSTSSDKTLYDENPLGEVFPDINVKKIQKEVVERKVNEKALEISGLDEDVVNGIDYMEDSDPRKIQYKFALIMAKYLIVDSTQPVIFKCPSCRKKRLRLIKGKTCYFWSCDNCKSTYDNSKTGIPVVYISEPASKQQYATYDLYRLALIKSGLTQDDIDGMEYMEENDPRIYQYKEAIRISYVEITGDTKAIPTDILPPYKIFVLVSIKDKNTGIYYTKKLYSYFLGNRKDVSEGDDVIVYVKKGRHPQRRIAKVVYISNSYVPPLNVTKSPISIKVKGKFLASKHGKRFHDPCCKQMDKISNNEAIWFQSEIEAMNRGYAPCAKCIL